MPLESPSEVLKQFISVSYSVNQFYKGVITALFRG